MATLSLFQRGEDRITDDRPAHICNLIKRGEPLMIARRLWRQKPGHVSYGNRKKGGTQTGQAQPKAGMTTQVSAT